MNRALLPLAACACLFTALAAEDRIQADEPKPNQAELDFFEAKVRPLLVRRCYECHAADKAKGSLALDSRVGWQRGGDTGPAIVPGKPDDSLFIRAVEYRESGYEMPPSGKLPAEELAILRQWVSRGAVDPREAVPAAKTNAGIDLAAGRQFWSFRPVKQTEPPAIHDSTWPRTDSDRFLLAALEHAGLKPAADNEPARFLRRLHYDLTGLPPAAESVAPFVQEWNQGGEAREVALSQVVDRLLSSRQFAEKWARHWLDLARYADSNGASFNPPFLQAWRYRNWVIDAVERDLPYDQFIRAQIAGDLLPAASQAERDGNLIATGFLMLGSKVLGEFDKEQLTLDVVDEQLDTIGKAVLGLTLGCARCHDHKFDPIPQRDYYALAGIFTSTVTLQDRLGGALEDESDWSRRGLGPGGDERLQTFLRQHRYEWVKSGQKAYSLRSQIARNEARLQKLAADDQERQSLTAELAKQRADLSGYEQRLTELAAELPPYAEAVAEQSEIHDEQLRIRGVAAARSERVPRGFLQVAGFEGPPQVPKNESGRRELAEWITSPNNPLTARVFVNRVWQHLYAEGLVRSVDNFGVRGERPSHPELLDHLASRFVTGGWRLKPLVRELVLSRAYRVETRLDAETRGPAIDPENRLLWRQNKRRLEPEEIRDSLLLLSGDLDLRPAESLIAHLPLSDINGSFAEALVIRDHRRSIYQPLIRTLEPDIYQVFDFANPAVTTGQRAATTVAPQSLFFLNAPFVQESAAKFARRLLRRSSPKAETVERVFQETVNRPPTNRERQLLLQYLSAQGEGESLPTPHDLAKLCQAVFASTQFQFLD